MKKYISEFFRRGLLACGSGPVVLAILYLILRHTDNIEVLTVNQVCIGIFSITLLAFVVGGMNVIYQIAVAVDDSNFYSRPGFIYKLSSDLSD